MKASDKPSKLILENSKLILENRTELPLQEFLEVVLDIVEWGRISNDGKQFCNLTSFTIDNEEYHIVSYLNKKSDKLILYKVPVYSKEKVK